MSDIFLTNSLTRKKEKFVPLDSSRVGMYTCGPTVYDYATIGNFRTYTLSDLINRVLRFGGYQVKFIMNITDVGHLSGDNSGDADTGEDRMEKGAKREGKNAWDVAKFYTGAFLSDFKKLNLTQPEIFTKATDYIKEQIDLVKKLEEKGLTYKTSDGIYFSTEEYEKKTGFKYGELSDMDQIKEGARVEPNPEKKNPRDFALWKFSEKPGERHMEWDSPWGMGFPGWHIECSAMSMKYLGESFDLHAGGEDIKQTHHVNEIAQSQALTGKQFVKYWVHGAFLTVNGGRMGKSLGNAYTVADIEKKGFDPLALRYFYFTSHYRMPLNFTWEALAAASAALEKMREHVRIFKNNDTRTVLSEEKRLKTQSFSEDFKKALFDDLNIPQALAVVWAVIKSNIPSEDKYDLLINFDEVLGFNLATLAPKEILIPQHIVDLAKQREEVRKAGDFAGSDEIRKKIEKEGYGIQDTSKGTAIFPLKVKS